MARRSRRFVLVLAVAALAVAVVVAVAGSGHESANTPNISAANALAAMPGSTARFSYLSAQRTNRCDLSSAGIVQMAPGQRLQGSCCTAMDQTSYRHQVAQLGKYAALPEVPRDPYDVPARLARRLLGYEHTITLTPSQQGTYRRAMRMTREHGPCCCRCWRWDAFKGLSHYLIARRRWSASQVAHLIDALDGCGGSDNAPAGSAMSQMS
jgi:hypothetical protein